MARCVALWRSWRVVRAVRAFGASWRLWRVLQRDLVEYWRADRMRRSCVLAHPSAKYAKLFTLYFSSVKRFCDKLFTLFYYR